MSEGPVEVGGPRTDPVRPAPSSRADGQLPGHLRSAGHRVAVKADLLPALLVVCLVTLLGLPLGWSWSRLAPVQRSIVAPDGELVPLPIESYHRFTALAIFLLLGAVAGVLTAVLLWMIRSRRGPILLVAAVAGSLASAGLAAWAGTLFAARLHPAPAPPESGDVVAVAPGLDTPWVVIIQPLAVALIYGLAASWNGSDDLGRGPDGGQDR